RHTRGDLAGAEEYYSTGLKYFEDPGFRLTREPRMSTFAYASWNAWMLGRPNVALERISRQIVNDKNPYDVALSGFHKTLLLVYMRQYEHAEALAAQVLEVSEKNRIPNLAALSRCVLGHARARLGRAKDGVLLIRRGKADLLEMGARDGVGRYTEFLAAAQGRDGAIVEALETVEQALQANPDELAYRPEIFRTRGELRLKREQTEVAEADFREAIALAQKMGAKAWELRATVSLARLLGEQRRRDEARVMLAEIYNWFTKGF